MASISAWFGTGALGSLSLYHPYNVASLIAYNPSVIAIDGLGARTVAAQTVRIEMASTGATEALTMGGNALVNKQRMVVLGYKNHPTIPDTDIQQGDEFFYAEQRYRVVKTETHFRDRIIAIAESQE